jgi:hypothetical protein
MKNIILTNLDQPPEERLKQNRARTLRRVFMALNVAAVVIFFFLFFIRESVLYYCVLVFGYVLLGISMYGQIRFAKGKKHS